MPISREPCPACGGRMMHEDKLAPKDHYCLSEGCFFEKEPMPNALLGVTHSLLRDRERAGYTRALAEVTVVLDSMAGK